MSLNYSYCSVFPVSSCLDDDFGSARRDREAGVSGSCCWSSNSTLHNLFDYGADFGWMDGGEGCLDIVDLLPTDPFGMGIGAGFTATLASLAGDHHAINSCDYDLGEEYLLMGLDDFHLGSSSVSSRLVADSVCAFNSRCNLAGDHFASYHEYELGEEYLLMGLDDFHLGSSSVSSRLVADSVRSLNSGCNLTGDHFTSYHEYELEEDYVLLGLDDFHLGSSLAPSGLVAESVCAFQSGCSNTNIGGLAAQVSSYDRPLNSVSGGDEEVCSSGEEMVPHSGLLFCLGYLDVMDLISMERVCKSLYSAVQDDELLWRSICIEPPLSQRISDDGLMCLTQRSRGSLSCLGLFGCSWITDYGMKRVLESNPKLKKLSVPGCLRLSLENLIHILMALKFSGALALTHISLGRTFNVTQENFKDLKFILGVDECKHAKASRPRFYHSYVPSLASDDDCAIDVEICPGCHKLKIIYDCASEECYSKGSECRACDVCIARCVQCGRCIKNCEYEETFCLENLCLGCSKKPPKCQGTF